MVQFGNGHQQSVVSICCERTNADKISSNNSQSMILEFISGVVEHNRRHIDVVSGLPGCLLAPPVMPVNILPLILISTTKDLLRLTYLHIGKF